MAGSETAARPALAATLHDPEGRFLALLGATGHRLAGYANVVVAATEATDGQLLAALRERGVNVLVVAPGAVGAARREALSAVQSADPHAVVSCDFDRWLHWASRFPDELDALPQRAERTRSAPWYVCLGRTARAFGTHPRVQRDAESATNHALALALGRRIDATAGAAWLSPEGLAIVLAESVEPTAATDLEWPALVARADPRRVGFLAAEGLEFETATFYADQISAAGSLQAWVAERYERPEVWAARLRLAADSVSALARVLADVPPLRSPSHESGRS